MNIVFGILVTVTAFVFMLNNNVKNYLSVKGPIEFKTEKYHLAWSSLSDDGYYKQEYVRQDDNVQSFNRLILLELLLRENISLEAVVRKKIKEIEHRKGKDPIANYKLIENKKTGEYLLDFMISIEGIYEWNAYRYKLIETSKGKAVLLFGFSLRGFNEGEIVLDDFFPFIEEQRIEYINSLAGYTLPTVTISE